MTKKDYELIASAIKPAVDNIAAERRVINNAFFNDDELSGGQRWLQEVAGRLARNFEIDNPRFDRKRFYEACGLEELK